jgi:hypothetical protein
MWAGQPTAALSRKLTDDNYEKPFSIFMRRSKKVSDTKFELLGWEYCGEYIAVEDSIEVYQKLKNNCDRAFVIHTLKKGLKKSKSSYHQIIADNKDRIRKVLEAEPDSGEAEELRSLGLDNEQLSNDEFVEKVVYWRGLLEQKYVKFVRYDEKMYDFIKDGETTRNKRGKKRKCGEPPALASDWYGDLDKRVG